MVLFAPQQSSPVKGRPYRSKRQRPCDFCRRRKTCCIIEDKPPCVTCTQRGIECKFTEGVHRGKPKKQRTEIKFYVPKVDGRDLKEEAKEGRDVSSDTPKNTVNEKSIVSASNTPTAPLMNKQSSGYQLISLEDSSAPQSSLEFDLPLTIDMWNLMFHDLQDDSLDADLAGVVQKRTPKTPTPQQVASPLPSFHLQSQGINRFRVCSFDQMCDYIRGSVDADESIKAQFLPENSYMDPYLYAHMSQKEVGPLDGERHPKTDSPPTSRSALPPGVKETVFFRDIGTQPHPHTSPPVLLLRNDPGLSTQDVAAKERIRKLIGNFGPRLLLIYFRYISPFLPLFSRGLFYFGTTQNMLEFHNSLLATLLTLAMDYWQMDAVLAQHTPPSDDTLFKIATSALMMDITMPNYSTLQAAVLISQKRPEDMSKPDTPFVWTVLGMAGSLAETMGYNNDCLEWHIPKWEKGLRRRIWWTYVVQDVWYAACYGRTLHISSRYWHVSPLTAEDFESYSMNEQEAENFRVSVVSFCFLADLSRIVASICDDFLYSAATGSFVTVYTVGQMLLGQVTSLEQRCPGCLQISSQTTSEVAWAGGSVQFALQSAKILVLRHMLHRLQQTDAKTKAEYRDRVHGLCVDCLRVVMETADQIKAVHFQYFWYSWTRLNFVLIANFFLLVYSVSDTPEERKEVKEMMDNYRWWLRCNVTAFADLSLALVVLDDAYKGLSKLGVE